MKILLLGKNGQIGWELQRTMATLGEVFALGRSELDLCDQVAIRSIVRTINPDLIVNAAAYTAVDMAEEEPELAMAINSIAPGILAEESSLLKIPLVHYSTDYVFDGSKNSPYKEQDAPNPINSYGRSKLAGEEAILQTDCRHLILRTSWVYSLRGSNFLLTIIRLAAIREELAIVNDQYGAPTWSRMIAEATAQILAADKSLKRGGGIYNLTAAGTTTWFYFAQSIIAYALAEKMNKPAIKPISTDDYKTSAKRPVYSILDNTALNQDFSIILPDWETSLKLLVEEVT